MSGQKNTSGNFGYEKSFLSFVAPNDNNGKRYERKDTLKGVGNVFEVGRSQC